MYSTNIIGYRAASPEEIVEVLDIFPKSYREKFEWKWKLEEIGGRERTRSCYILRDILYPSLRMMEVRMEKLGARGQ